MAVAAVHPALAADIPEIARIQRETWLTAYSELLPPTVLAGLDTESTEQAWLSALEDGAARLFVATEGSWTVGFCTAGPAPDGEIAAPDGSLPPDAATTALIGTLLVEPRWGRRGHGGRLLGTAAAALRVQGATRGVVWVPERDTASRAFYTRVGWSPDGTARTLDAGGQPLRELRFSGTLELVLKDEGRN
ncbi:MAG TPA: GNAT family N-acetyltransferase [Pseudonocardiaceae bacterium]|jgi:GNAT superfamily N-acetyltransferase|nr:GNAT family N-acetyltransferase [Pseudonocardiaceae bacterium]